MHVLTTQIPVFRLAVRPERAIVAIELEGELDCASAPRVQEALDELRAAGWDAIAVDLGAVTFVDSTGLRLLLRASARSREEGWRLELRGDCPPLERLLSVTGLESWFTSA